MDKKEKVFADGFFAEKKEIEKAPWVKASISIKVSDATPFLQMHENKGGYVNLTLKESQKGTYYLELDTFEPKEKTSEAKEQPPVPLNGVEYPEEEVDVEDIPF